MALTLLGLAIALLAAGSLSSCTMSALTQVTPQAFPTPLSCGDCHVEIYDEWRQSPHAMAFTNERFRRATDNYRFEQCLGCHAPQPSMVTAEPIVRATDRDAGVACVACHLDQGVMVGPLEPTGFARPHPIRVDSAPFENGVLCGHCHQGTLAQWQAADIPDKQDCRHCHMPAVKRKITQSTGLISKPIVAAEDIAPQHRHTFSLVAGELAGESLKLDVTRVGDTLEVALQNQLPHALPTGDFGVRIIEILVRGADANGRQIDLASWELSNSGNRSLAAGASKRWTLPLPQDVAHVTVTITREGRDGSNRAQLLRKELRLP